MKLGHDCRDDTVCLELEYNWEGISISQTVEELIVGRCTTTYTEWCLVISPSMVGMHLVFLDECSRGGAYHIKVATQSNGWAIHQLLRYGTNCNWNLTHSNRLVSHLIGYRHLILPGSIGMGFPHRPHAPGWCCFSCSACTHWHMVLKSQ